MYGNDGAGSQEHYGKRRTADTYPCQVVDGPSRYISHSDLIHVPKHISLIDQSIRQGADLQDVIPESGSDLITCLPNYLYSAIRFKIQWQRDVGLTGNTDDFSAHFGSDSRLIGCEKPSMRVRAFLTSRSMDGRWEKD